MKRFEIFFGIIKIPLDFFITILAFLAAYELRLITEPITGISKPIDYSVLPTINEYLIFSLSAALALIAIFTLGKLYILKSTHKFSKEAGRVTLLCGVWAMAIISYFYFTRTFPFSRLAMAYSWALTILFILSSRGIIKIIEIALLKSGIGKRRLLLIGENKITEKIIEKLSQDPSYKIIGIIKEGEEIIKTAKRRRIDEIIQTKATNKNASNELIQFCELNSIGYRFIPDLIDVSRTNIAIDTISGIPIITLKPTPLDGWGKVIKRTLDITGSLAGIILLSPILLITALAIKIDSKGPIIFSKLDDGSPVKRIGQKSKPFRFYKFRSMRNKSDSLRYTQLAEKNTRQSGPLVKIKNDPRVTRVGRFIRRYSIDELPQLWSVLIGNMSLVGPRPHLPEEVEKYEKHHKFVLTIKPGATGLAQVSGRSDLSFEEEVRLDRYYIENWSLLFDIRIIFRTIGVVLKGHKE